MKFIAVFVFACLAVSAHYSRAHAQLFTDLYVFGDSLSDTGNVRVATSDRLPPTPPYLKGRWSNGPVWVEHVAAGLGLPSPEASLEGGKNYAWSGAQTGRGNSTLNGVPNVGPQIEAFRASGSTIEETDLVVVWAGHNDPGQISAATSIANLSSHMTTLHGEGARNFLVGNFGLFGAEALNPLFDEMIAHLESTLSDTSIFYFDFNGLLDEAVTTPLAFGLTNVLDPACLNCDTFSPKVVGNPDEYLYWDEYLHPTGTFHQIMGERALAAIPEPSSLPLLLIAMMWCLRHKRAARTQTLAAPQNA